MKLHIIILAAGKGTRMRSNLPKVLHKLGGKALLEHVIQTAQSLKPEKIHVVYGDGGNMVPEQLKQYEVNWVLQDKQLGTGHAVMQVLPFIEHASQVLILYGDVPLITATTLEELITNLPQDGLSLLTANFEEPTGFGRIVRDEFGNITAIIEHKDATPAQLQIKEINSGILTTSSQVLRSYLPRLNHHNAQGEYYLTDIIALLVADHAGVNGLLSLNTAEISGINDKKQLAMLERYYQKNLAEQLMRDGLTLIDPTRFDLRGDLTIGRDVVIDINAVIEGKVHLSDNTAVGPNNYLKNAQIGKNVTIKANCVIEDAVIDDECVIGPFARIRPGSYLKSGAHVGNFVEIKNSTLGFKSKANHLTYLGDAVIGNNVNVGAGTITCNYDGANKHTTIIEDGAFIGSDVALVAPVKIGKNSTIGAGSIITCDTPPEKLTIARARQTVIENWQRPQKAAK